MPNPKYRSAAFTIVELLVVIAIIGILTSLLIPAVQLAREAGRRSQCVNNLKQIGLAYLQYESAYQAFPPSAIQPPPPTYDDIVKYPPVGWGIFLLPHLEQKPLFDMYNFKAPFWDGYPANERNQYVATTQIVCFRCPSAPQRNPYEYSYPGTSITWKAAAADYSPIARVHEDLANTLLGLNLSENQRKGVLEPNKNTSTNAISDGTSHTILVAEMAGKNDLWQNGKNTYQKLSGLYGGQGGWADTTSADSVLIGSTGDGTTAPGDYGINTSNEYGLYSFHRYLANALIADGSVQSLLGEINIRVLVGMITRAGGELEDNP